MSIDKPVAAERSDFVESGKEGLKELAEIVLFLIFQHGPCVEPARLDDQFEEDLKSAEALLNGFVFAIAAGMNAVGALLDATQQTPCQFKIERKNKKQIYF